MPTLKPKRVGRLVLQAECQGCDVTRADNAGRSKSDEGNSEASEATVSEWIRRTLRTTAASA